LKKGESKKKEDIISRMMKPMNNYMIGNVTKKLEDIENLDFLSININ
jgi:hypothetical protein